MLSIHRMDLACTLWNVHLTWRLLLIRIYQKLPTTSFWRNREGKRRGWEPSYYPLHGVKFLNLSQASISMLQGWSLSVQGLSTKPPGHANQKNASRGGSARDSFSWPIQSWPTSCTGTFQSTVGPGFIKFHLTCANTLEEIPPPHPLSMHSPSEKQWAVLLNA